MCTPFIPAGVVGRIRKLGRPWVGGCRLHPLYPERVGKVWTFWHPITHPTGADRRGWGGRGAEHSQPAPHLLRQPRPRSPPARPPARSPRRAKEPGDAVARSAVAGGGRVTEGAGPGHPTPQLSPKRGLRRPSLWAGEALADRSRAGSSSARGMQPGSPRRAPGRY
jgi:hypothetical protein